MEYLQQAVFLAVIGATAFLLARRIARIRGNIMLGKAADLTDNNRDRLKKMLLVAFGQQKMFTRFTPAILHLFIYAGFLIINLEVLEFVLDGLLGTHRFFAPLLGGFYPVLMNVFELLTLLVLFSCVIFLIRRNVLKVKRFHGREMRRWPTLDANLILVIEIVLMLAILTMNASDRLLQSRGVDDYVQTGHLFFSSMLIPLPDHLSDGQLVLIERFAWWFHILGILGFAVYITYSKHLHIALAFPNTYYSSLLPAGQMRNMESVTNEVNIMLGIATDTPGTPPAEVGRFGAKDVNDLTRINILNAYTCTECGRCTSQCPANQTGKKLSPRKIMMDVRDRAEEMGASLAANGSGAEDGRSLLDDYITKEEINACTGCNACVEACPININPLEIILEMRRYVAMEESGSPASWNAMFQNIETSFAPWKFAPSARADWARDLSSKNVR